MATSVRLYLAHDKVHKQKMTHFSAKFSTLYY